MGRFTMNRVLQFVSFSVLGIQRIPKNETGKTRDQSMTQRNYACTDRPVSLKCWDRQWSS